MNGNNLKKLEEHDKNNLTKVEVIQNQFNNYKERMGERPSYDTNEKKDVSPIFAYILIVAIMIIIVIVAVFIFMERG